MLLCFFGDITRDIIVYHRIAENDHAVYHIIIYEAVYLDLAAHDILGHNSLRAELRSCHKV